MTPETIQQYACVGFFLVSAGFVALITARVVLINGPERWDKAYDEFDDGRPHSLTLLLVNDKGQREWAALLGDKGTGSCEEIEPSRPLITLFLRQKHQGVLAVLLQVHAESCLPFSALAWNRM